MSNINYEEDVKKCYPLAKCEGLAYRFFIWTGGHRSFLLGSGATENDAWQSAYQTLKQQGKIK